MAQQSGRRAADHAAAAMRRESSYHEARVLLLLSAFAADGEFVGLTKLVKLDFLLRYPLMAERVFPDGISWPDSLKPTDYEQLAVESRMIRYKYGPFDDRYYPIIGALVGRQLAVFVSLDRPLRLRIEARGVSLARDLALLPYWGRVYGRARFLSRHLDLDGQRLKELIYEKLPEIVEIPIGQEI